MVIIAGRITAPENFPGKKFVIIALKKPPPGISPNNSSEKNPPGNSSGSEREREQNRDGDRYRLVSSSQDPGLRTGYGDAPPA
jgi:hypothetical protein